MKEKRRKKEDGVVKVKPHVYKRSLTSASALYSFLTATHIPAVGPGMDQDEGGGSVLDFPTPPTPPTRSKRPKWRATCGVTLEFY